MISMSKQFVATRIRTFLDASAFNLYTVATCQDATV